MPSFYYIGFMWFACTTASQGMWCMVQKQFPEIMKQHKELLEKKRIEHATIKDRKNGKGALIALNSNANIFSSQKDEK